MARLHFLTSLSIVANMSASASYAVATQTTSESPKEFRVSVFEQIDRINTENALLAAKAANAKLRKKLADAEAGHDGTATAIHQPRIPQPFDTQYTPPPTNMAPRTAVALLVTSSPHVNGGRPTALIQLPNGSRMNAAVGTKVPGVGVLRVVSVNEVTAFDGKKTVVVPFDAGMDFTSGGR